MFLPTNNIDFLKSETITVVICTSIWPYVESHYNIVKDLEYIGQKRINQISNCSDITDPIGTV